jgi:hypothetical protein
VVRVRHPSTHGHWKASRICDYSNQGHENGLCKEHCDQRDADGAGVEDDSAILSAMDSAPGIEKISLRYYIRVWQLKEMEQKRQARVGAEEAWRNGDSRKMMVSKLRGQF